MEYTDFLAVKEPPHDCYCRNNIADSGCKNGIGAVNELKKYDRCHNRAHKSE